MMRIVAGLFLLVAVLPGCRDLVNPGMREGLESGPAEIHLTFEHPDGGPLYDLLVEIDNDAYANVKEEQFRFVRYTDTFGHLSFPVEFDGYYNVLVRPEPHWELPEHVFVAFSTEEQVQTVRYPGVLSTLRVVLPEGFPEFEFGANDIRLTKNVPRPGSDYGYDQFIHPFIHRDGTTFGYLVKGVWSARLFEQIIDGTAVEIAELDWRWSDVEIREGGVQIDLVIDAAPYEVRWTAPLNARTPKTIHVEPNWGYSGTATRSAALSGTGTIWARDISAGYDFQDSPELAFRARRESGAPNGDGYWDAGQLGEDELEIVFTRSGTPVVGQWAQVTDTLGGRHARSDPSGSAWFWTFGDQLLVEWEPNGSGGEFYRLLDVSQTTNTTLEIDLDDPQ